ncbi:putative transmembrane protein [Toxoplasma gondii FOU]|uniref:Putative transmembrane protein n=3 Tax=Toxoplasma gondii TaxID=5811 RepID=A0A086LB25_TOXGO|nr:putative transmembrane protein [Toxoplasma gondii FOU]PUA91443.1 putative transmembrane protein [Toxoplasma gondii TgCATBr9]RQX68303.1 putative transmembrane protein [Toxoplasma gondii CAST]
MPVPGSSRVSGITGCEDAAWCLFLSQPVCLFPCLRSSQICRLSRRDRKNCTPSSGSLSVFLAEKRVVFLPLLSVALLTATVSSLEPQVLLSVHRRLHSCVCVLSIFQRLSPENMGLLAPDVLCTLLVVFFILRVGSFLHLWRLWTTGLAIPVGIAPSPRKDSSGSRGDKQEGAAHAAGPLKPISLWPVARLAGLGVLEGFQELREASNFLLSSLGCTAAVALLLLFRWRVPSDGKQFADSLSSLSPLSSPEGRPGGLSPLPLLLLAFGAFVRLQWTLHRRFLPARRKLPVGHRIAMGFFVGGGVGLVLVSDFLGVNRRFEFTSLLPAYFRELWGPLIESADFCECAFDTQLHLFQRVWSFFLFGVKAAFVAFLAFEGAVLAAPIQVEANLISVALYATDCLQPGTEDVVKRLQLPLIHLEKLAIPLLVVLPFLWMPSVYATLLSETGLSSLGFGGVRLLIVCIAALLLLRRAKLAAQVSTVLAMPAGEARREEQAKTAGGRTATRPSTANASRPSSPSVPTPTPHPSRSLLLRLLDLLGLPARLLILMALCSLLLLLQAQQGRDGPLLLSSLASKSTLGEVAPLDIPRRSLSPVSASVSSSSPTSKDTASSGDAASTDASSPAVTEGSSKPERTAAGGFVRRDSREAHRTCALLWSFLGDAEQRRKGLQTLGNLSVREKISWTRDAARVLLPFNSSSFVPFLQQLCSTVLVGTAATAAFLFSFASTEVRRRGLQQLSIWDVHTS